MSSETPTYSSQSNHTCVVLFYKYFLDEYSFLSSLISSSSSSCSPIIHMKEFLRTTCTKLQMKGRILLSVEGINGTISAKNQDIINSFIDQMKDYEIEISEEEKEEDSKRCLSSSSPSSCSLNIFQDIDWKFSNIKQDFTQECQEPFPDLKIVIAKEIVSTGNSVSVDDISQYGGKHITPKEFHHAIKEGWGIGDDNDEKEKHHKKSDKNRCNNDDYHVANKEINGSNNKKQKGKELVVIDVRNTFEYNIGHFLNPEAFEANNSKHVAMNPEMVTFSSFNDTFCVKNSNYLRDKKVLMYCTGGIRCEKASVMLRKQGIEDVYQLKGGIHKYLEEYPDGFFKGKNFVFDQRVALEPESSTMNDEKKSNKWIVGKCIECKEPYDEISGSRLCTVCRDLVLVCNRCRHEVREFHCNRHVMWKKCYFTFLEIFYEQELSDQLKELQSIYEKSTGQKNTRKTLSKQITKVKSRIDALKKSEVQVERDAPRRCRTCRETEPICDGLCWGFWKTSKPPHTSIEGENERQNSLSSIIPKLSIQLGSIVEPGHDWNEYRLGKKSSFKRGKVVDIKSWCSGGEKDDSISVVWEHDSFSEKGGDPLIYRWGVLDKTRKRRYDVQLAA